MERPVMARPGPPAHGSGEFPLSAAGRPLAALRARVAALAGGATRPDAAGPQPLGLPGIDEALPGGGLARGALHEVIAGPDPAERAAATGFCARIAGRLMAASGRDRAADGMPAMLWVFREEPPHGPGLDALGAQSDRILFVRAGDDAEALMAMEEGLRCAGLAAVLGETDSPPPRADRRLQLAAAASGVTALLLRRMPGEAAADAPPPSVAATRWRVRPAPGPDGAGRPCWEIRLLRCRGGTPREAVVTAPRGPARKADVAEL